MLDGVKRYDAADCPADLSRKQIPARASIGVYKLKRGSRVLLVLFLLLPGLLACGKREEPREGTIQVYYLGNAETKVEPHAYELKSMSLEGQVEELMTCLATNPEKLEYKAPLSMGFEVLGIKLEEERLQVNVDAAYQDLPVITEVLVRAAIVRTLTQLQGISYVEITVEGNQLYDSTGSLVGWMNAEQFINNDGNEINTYELARVRLYFASQDGTNLIAAYREKHYSSSMPLERFVVEELISGPSGQVEGLYPSINPNTKIINITTRDGICYVNLDDSFLTVVDNVSTDVSVYSIVNSLVELNNVNKVQILINGEVPSSFSAATFERNLDIVIVQEK